MGAADRATIEAGTPGLVLMERAGAACTRAGIALAGGVGGRAFTVLAGPGNNGGDGFVVARRLYDAGASVEVLLVGDARRIGGDALVNLERLRTRPVPVRQWSGAVGDADVVVDALFGTGFRGALDGDAAAAAQEVGASSARVMAVDIPSGVDGLTGAVEGTVLTADVTVAIQSLKLGHVLDPGARSCGTVEVCDIGIGTADRAAEMADLGTAVAAVPLRSPDANKWSAGAVMVLGGSAAMAGAPGIVADAALRAGAGLVVAGVPATVAPVVASYRREVMTVALPQDDGRLTAAAMAEADSSFALGRFGAVAIGPGLARGSTVTEFVGSALQVVPCPVVLDADGLNAVSAAVLRERADGLVVTPHEGEFARLGGDLGAAAHRVDAVARAAEDWGCTVLLKGPATVVASPGRVPTVCRYGGAELATAGSGDALTGVLAAYPARGADLHEAAVAAACVHARAGALAAADGRNVVAGDIAGFFGAVEAGART